MDDREQMLESFQRLRPDLFPLQASLNDDLLVDAEHPLGSFQLQTFGSRGELDFEAGTQLFDKGQGLHRESPTNIHFLET
ncbi:hypothetical protein [Methylocystis sp. Sn-Cys]|uniref:hypothetical protein n=1 Tax=Methylocystis sp. Sn-Cys TaxID=1701263 RepID=UPI0019219035|nr:hypothetical protein [Methylocystis sp. Sn-Cys]MBL1256464.1 hypothetical protein [Methylocystis sp. Sn-Cys]